MDNHLTPDRRRRILSSIEECDRFISKEEGRAADLRPAPVAKLLDGYKRHRVNLLAMLDTGGNTDGA